MSCSNSYQLPDGIILLSTQRYVRLNGKLKCQKCNFDLELCFESISSLLLKLLSICLLFANGVATRSYESKMTRTSTFKLVCTSKSTHKRCTLCCYQVWVCCRHAGTRLNTFLFSFLSKVLGYLGRCCEGACWSYLLLTGMLLARHLQFVCGRFVSLWLILRTFDCL